MTAKAARRTAPTTEKRYEVTVKVDDGRDPWTTQVSALDEWKARTRAMMVYPVRLSGQFVDYEVREIA
jgi:hypothetical protein